MLPFDGIGERLEAVVERNLELGRVEGLVKILVHRGLLIFTQLPKRMAPIVLACQLRLAGARVEVVGEMLGICSQRQCAVVSGKARLSDGRLSST